VKGKLEDWPKLPPIPIEPEEDDLTEEHKVWFENLIRNVPVVAPQQCCGSQLIFSDSDPQIIIFGYGFGFLNQYFDPKFF
jgi:hypothetical protein